MTRDVAELFRALAVLSEPPEPSHAAVAEALGLPGLPTSRDYTEVFLLQVYPYASIYLGEKGMMGGEARDRVAGFWRALGLVPPPEPDHVAALLGLYASLVEAEIAEPDPARAVLLRSSRRALLWEHLLSWSPPYLAKVAAMPSPVYATWAELLSDALIAEATMLGREDALPLALRDAAVLPDPHDAASDWISALLAPVRCGMILTRADLGRAARKLDIGLRVGERAFILRALLEQDPGGTAAWLGGEAERAARSHQAFDPVLVDIAAFWKGRAEAATTALGSLQASA